MSAKELDQTRDISVQTSVVNEVIQITGSFFSGTQGGNNTFYTKKYLNITSGSFISGGFFETIYDGSPSSVSSSALIDLSYGHYSASYQADSSTFLQTEKNRVYKEMAGLLLGNTKSVFSFNSTNYHNLFFMMFKRRVFKDEVKKGDLSISLQITGAIATNGSLVTLSDAGAASAYTEGPAGAEANLYSGSVAVGKVYYDAGVVAFHTGVFYAQGVPSPNDLYWSGSAASVLNGLNQISVSGNIDNIIDGFRNRINQVNLQNQVNLNSTIYFCRAYNNEFNYSTNPTFVDSENKVIPTSGTDNQTRSYICSCGLYDVNNNLLAVAKLSEPVKKSPDNEVTIRVRLSY